MSRFTAEFDQIKVTDTEGVEWEVAFTREVDYHEETSGEKVIDEDNHVDTQVNYGGVWTDVDKLHPAQQHAINSAIETWKQENEPSLP